MIIYFICNNLFENNLSYSDHHDLEKKKMTRPLSSDGERVAKNVATSDEFIDTDMIYSSIYSSSLDTAKYLAERLDKKIFVDENLNDCKVGILGTKSIKMVKLMQNHDFDVKCSEGESINDVARRINSLVDKILRLGESNKVLLFTHKRVLLSYLVKHADTGYNLDDDLVVSFGERVVYDESDKDIDIVKVTYDDKEVVDIEVIDL